MRRPNLIAVSILVALLATTGVASANGGFTENLLNRILGSYGYHIEFTSSHIGISHTQLLNVHVVNEAGEPVFAAQRIDVGYSIWDFIRKTRAYGLHYLTIVNPAITLVHHANGTYNVEPLKGGGANNKSTPPWDVKIDVTGGSVAFIDRFSAAPKTRVSRIVDLNVRGGISPTQRTSYTAGMTLETGGRRYPISGNGRFDAAAGYESQHWSAPMLPIAAIVAFGLPTNQIAIHSGDLRNLDVRMFGLRGRDGTMDSHMGGHAVLEHVDITAVQLQKPVHDLHGPIAVADGAITMPHMRASLGTIPIDLAGGVYDFSSPTVRFGVKMAAALQDLKKVSAAAASRPISGPVAMRLLATGPVSSPLVFVNLSSGAIQYKDARLSNVHALIAMQGSEADILEAALRYGTIGVDARGSVLLEKQPVTRIVARVSASSNRVPYAAQIVPNMPLRAVAVLSGTDPKLSFAAVVDGASRTQHLSAIANVAGDGTGTVGPLSIDGPNKGSLLATVALDRPHDRAEVLASANNFAVRPAPSVSLPGFHVPKLPSVAGTIDAHAVAFQRGKGLDYLGGDAAVSRAQWNGMELDRMLAMGEMVRNNVNLVADVHGNAAAFHRMGMPIEAGQVEAVADVRGPLKNPQANVSALLDGGVIANAPVYGSVVLAYDGHDSLALVHSAVSIGGGLGTASGTVSAIRSGSPHFDISAQMREADIAVLTKTFGAKLPYPEGRIEADAHVRGTGKNPSVSGDVSIPEASINALPFQAQTAFNGDASHIVTHGGTITVGSSRIAFAADVGKTAKAMTISSRALNLADFNDYFPAAETLGGSGSLLARLDSSGSALSTQGTVAISHVRYRRYHLGNTYAHWNTAGQHATANASVQGQGGTVRLAANALLGRGTAPGTIVQNTFLDANATVRGFDLATWLPAAGVNAPILGTINADAKAHGRVHTIAVAANATLVNGLINQIAVQRLTIAATANRGIARIVSANFDIPYLSATASGTLGLSPNAPLDLTMHANSPDIGSLAKSVTHKPSPFGGIVDTTLHATGRLKALALDDVIDIRRFTHGDFTIPHMHTEIAAHPGSIDVRNGSIAFVKGSAAFAAHVPYSIGKLAFRSPGGSAGLPINGTITANNIDVGQFASLLPKGTHLAGTLAGNLAVSGTDLAPQLAGALNLRNAEYYSNEEKTPLTHGTATLALAGTRATLSNAHFTVGKKGSLDSHGTFAVANLRDPMHASSMDIVTTMNDAVFNLPKYFEGQLDGTLAVKKPSTGLPALAGNFTVTHARIPAAGMLALALAKPKAGAPAQPIPLNFNVGIGNDVRVAGDGVNVGAAGAIQLSGTLAKPAISGEIASTGGTVNIYRDFTIRYATVTFPGTGIIPDLNLAATTYLSQPPTDVTMHVRGPATQLNMQLTSNPPYDKAQIMALMIGGPGFAGLTGLQTAQGQASTPIFQSIGNDVVNGLFAKAITEPLTSGLGSALGLQNVQFNYDIAGQGGFSALVSKKLSQKLSLQFTSSVGFPSRTSIGLRDEINKDSAAGFILYSTYGQQGLGHYSEYLTAQPGTNISVQAEQPSAGEQGFGLHYTRYLGKTAGVTH